MSVFFDSRNMQKRDTNSDTSGHSLLHLLQINPIYYWFFPIYAGCNTIYSVIITIWASSIAIYAYLLRVMLCLLPINTGLNTIENFHLLLFITFYLLLFIKLLFITFCYQLPKW